MRDDRLDLLIERVEVIQPRLDAVKQGPVPGVVVRAVVQALLVTVAVSLTTSLAVGAVVIDRVRITDLVKGGLS